MRVTWIKRLSKIAVPLVVVALLPLWLVQSAEPRAEHCADCARQRETRTWTLRYSGRTLWTRHTEKDTYVSTALTAHRFVGSHTHRWVAPRITANPLSPYLPPVRLSLAYVNTPIVAALLNNLGDYADPDSARHACEVVLAPEYSYLINHDLRFHKFPPRGFRDRVQFLAWWQNNAFSFFDHLREETIPD